MIPQNRDCVTPRVLVTDGGQRSALAATRSLGRAGFQVIVGETTKRCLAAVSRYCAGSVTYPSPYDDETRFLEALLEGVARERIDVIVPTTDLTSAILSAHKHRFEPRTTVAVVDSNRFWAASDKIQLHHLAESLNVPTPTLHFVEEPVRAHDLGAALSYPCVLKPSRSRLRHQGRWIAASVRHIASPEQFAATIRDRIEFQHPYMVQRRIQGDGYGVFALCRDGEPLVLFAHHRLREKPPSGGVSVLRESVALDPAIADLASRLLRALHWHGVAMVEFKREAATGRYYLMEVNGRLWGSLQLAIDAGVDFPVLLVRLYTGGVLEPVQGYRCGVRSRWILGDVDHFLGRLAGPRSRADGLAPLGRFLWDFFWPYQPNTRPEVERWSDMRPALLEINTYVRSILSSLRERIRPGSCPRARQESGDGTDDHLHRAVDHPHRGRRRVREDQRDGPD